MAGLNPSPSGIKEIDEKTQDQLNIPHLKPLESITGAYSCSESDTHGMATKLMQTGYTLSEDLIELCEKIAHAGSKILDQAVKSWVVRNSIFPLYNVGDRVTGQQYGYTFSEKDGNEIIKICRDKAQYVIYTHNMNLVVDAENVTGLSPNDPRQRCQTSLAGT